MAGLRAAQKEMTRKILVSAAMELFQSKGYAATTVNDIAAAAGTTRVTFYAYFSSRSDLARALIGELNDILGRSPSPEHGSTAGHLVRAVREGTRASLGQWLRERSEQWDTIRPYMNVTIEASTVDPELRGLVEEWLEEDTADIEQELDEAGRFEPKTRHARAVLAFAQLHEVGQHWREGRWQIDRDTLIELLTDSWLSLLADRDAPVS